MRFPWNRLFKNIADDTSKIKRRSYEETDHESDAKDLEVIGASRRNFFRNLTGVGVGIVASQELLHTEQLTPPIDPIVEELTRRVKELEARNTLQVVDDGNFIQEPFYYGSCSTHAFQSFTAVPHTLAIFPETLEGERKVVQLNNLRKM